MKKEDVEAFKDAENQEIPAAERLEEISKSEISFWIDEIEIRVNSLEECRLEYQVRNLVTEQYIRPHITASLI